MKSSAKKKKECIACFLKDKEVKQSSGLLAPSVWSYFTDLCWMLRHAAA